MRGVRAAVVAGVIVLGSWAPAGAGLEAAGAAPEAGTAAAAREAAEDLQAVKTLLDRWVAGDREGAYGALSDRFRREMPPEIHAALLERMLPLATYQLRPAVGEARDGNGRLQRSVLADLVRPDGRKIPYTFRVVREEGHARVDFFLKAQPWFDIAMAPVRASNAHRLHR